MRTSNYPIIRFYESKKPGDSFTQGRKYAIIEDGGKQFKAVEGESIEVDRFQSAIGEQVELDKVLLIVDEQKIQVGTPYIAEAKVEATVVTHFKGPKIVVFKYKPK